MSTIALLVAIEALYAAMRLIQMFLDNARYHHAKPVREWLAQPGRAKPPRSSSFRQDSVYWFR